MKRTIILLLTLALFPVFGGVDLVKDGKGLSEIIIDSNSPASVKVAAEELQKYIEKISGAKLPIVNTPAKDVKNKIYLGTAANLKTDDIKYDGFKIVTEGNNVLIAGVDRDHEWHFKRFENVENQSAEWEKITGHKWRTPSFWSYRDNKAGFHKLNATGTLYGVYELLEQFGFRWYMPVEGLGQVIPENKNLSVNEQNLKKEPEFGKRVWGYATETATEALWYKSMKVGTDKIMTQYHAIGRLTTYDVKENEKYFGTLSGKKSNRVPKLSSEDFKSDFMKYLEYFEQCYPGLEYTSFGQPDGWSALDKDDVKAGWDKYNELGYRGRFSDYIWNFNWEMRKRFHEKYPDKKITVYAYGYTLRPPLSMKDRKPIPEDITVVFCQTSNCGMLPASQELIKYREEWKEMLPNQEQLMIYDYYFDHAAKRKFPPIPVFFTKLMKENFEWMSGKVAGYNMDYAAADSSARAKTKLTLNRPALNHLMIYLHNRLSWDAKLDMEKLLDEYYTLFFGPAREEMKEFHEFAESVWMRPLPRTVALTGGYLKPEDVNKYFEILGRAKAKAGNTIYGERIDYLAAEMDSLKILFKNFERKGPWFDGFSYTENEKPNVDGDLDKAFWRWKKRPFGEESFHILSDMVTGKFPEHVYTKAGIRAAGTSLFIGVECYEPRMDKLHADCKLNDHNDIFLDDNVEIRLETPAGLRPWITINPNGAIRDYCVSNNVADLPEWYHVKKFAVKKYPDRWTVEVQIDMEELDAQIPSKSLPWGINICRQRKAGNSTEGYMLSPSGDKFGSLTAMGNLFIKK